MLKSVVKLEKSTLIRELGRLSESGDNESVCVILTIIVKWTKINFDGLRGLN
jgi:hypothetical protein